MIENPTEFLIFPPLLWLCFFFILSTKVVELIVGVNWLPLWTGDLDLPIFQAGSTFSMGRGNLLLLLNYNKNVPEEIGIL